MQVLKKSFLPSTFIFFAIVWLSCGKGDKSPAQPGESIPQDTIKGADVVSVEVSPSSNGKFVFSVGIFSPDIDCSQYANWWELVSEDGELIARRILVHSHVPPDFSQPFVRSKTVTIDSTTVVWIRGHMNNTGYKNGKAFKGSIAAGFSETPIPPDFALDLDNETPDCDF